VLGDPDNCPADDVVSGGAELKEGHHDFPEVYILEPRPSRIPSGHVATAAAEALDPYGTTLAMMVHVGTLPPRHGP